jgi:hypothetical protein
MAWSWRGWESLREPRSKRRKASVPRYGAQPRPRYQQAATFVDAARRMVGMRLSALRLPLITRGRIYLWCVVVSRVRARSRAARTISHSLLPGLTWLDPAIHAERRLAETYRNVLVGCIAAWTTRTSPVVTKKGASMRASAKQSRWLARESGIASSLSRLAMTSAYPPPRSEAERGGGTTRSVVEGVCGGAEADREAVAAPTALRAVPPPRWAGRDKKASHEN